MNRQPENRREWRQYPGRRTPGALGAQFAGRVVETLRRPGLVPKSTRDHFAPTNAFTGRMDVLPLAFQQYRETITELRARWNNGEK